MSRVIEAARPSPSHPEGHLSARSTQCMRDLCNRTRWTMHVIAGFDASGTQWRWRETTGMPPNVHKSTL